MNAFAGTVVGGTGSTYQVQLVDGPIVSASVLQIDAAETVPTGTGVVLALIGGVYYFQPPVWI